MKYPETMLVGWCQPARDTEEARINNAINMIKDAISRSDELNGLDIEVFVQGSYANNTNVKANSDVDVCVMLKSTVFTEFIDGLKNEDYGFAEGEISFADYKERVVRALQSKFGSENLTIGNKSVKIRSNSYHVDADAVIAFQFRNYKAINSRRHDNFLEGIKFISDNGDEVINYPKLHIQNGVVKNNNTNHEYKKLVRIMKRIRNNMVEDRVIDGNTISSFLIECLIWNVPNKTITGYSSWGETVKQAIAYLYSKIDESNYQEWGEVSERLYLFVGRKWDAVDVKEFLLKTWDYLGYEDEDN